MDSVYSRYLFCKAHSLGMKYPKYTFLSYGMYDSHWWLIGKKMSIDHCSPEDIAKVLQYSLAVLHFQRSLKSNNTFSHSCYDATFALAFALNKTIEEDTASSGTSGYIIKRYHLQSTNFVGKTGKVKFNADGIRDVADLRVLQYRKDYLNKTPIFGDGQTQNALMLIDVAYLKENNNNLQLVFFGGDKDGIWPSYIPYDGTARTKVTTIALPVTITLSVIHAGGIIFAMICLLFNIIYRKRRMVRLNSPRLNYLIITGVLIVYVGCILFVIPTHNPRVVSALCLVRTWLLSIGHSLGIGTVIAKLLRIYYIFKKQNSGSRKKAVYDWHLAVFVFGLVIVDLTILITYTALEGLISHFKAGTDVNREKPVGFEGDREIETEYLIHTCSVDKRIRLVSVGVIYLYKGILQLCALVFAFQTRKVKIEGLNDAKYIAAFMYTMSVIVAMTFISSLALYDYINVYAFVYSFGIWLAISAVLGFMFVPKMVSLYKDPDGAQVFAAHDLTLATKTLSQSLREIEGGSGNTDSSISALQQRIRELEDELTTRRVEQEVESFGQHSYHQCSK